MNDADFITVFNAGDSGYRDWWFPATGLIIVLLVLGRPLLVKVGILADKPLKKPWLPVAVLLFAVFWSVTAFLATYGNHVKSRETLLAGHAQYVEGVVQDFKPMPYLGHANESFTVKGVHFAYSDFVLTPGFNHTASHGGPIRAGQYVRVWYAGSDILKLQIQQNGNPPSAAPLPATAQPPRVTFSEFVFLSVGIGIAGHFFIKGRPTPQAKKKWSNRIYILQSVIFFACIGALFYPAGGFLLLLIIGSLIFLIACLNIRNTYFCGKCGERSIDAKWLVGTYACPKCGNKLR